jgi:hypothetical protein
MQKNPVFILFVLVQALCLLLVLAAPVSAGGRLSGTKGKAQPGGKPLPAVTEIFFCDVYTPDCRSTNSTFTVGTLRDLFVFVTWPNIKKGDFVQTVEFYLPGGSLYKKKDTSFRIWPGQSSALAVPGATPVPVQFLTSSNGVPTVVTHLPVAGTYITQYNLLGVWTVRVLLNGNFVQSAELTLQAPTPVAPSSGTGGTVTPGSGTSPAVTESFFCEAPTTDCRSSNSSFTVGALRDLYVFVTWPNVSGDLLQTVEFYLPGGSLYMKKDTQFRVLSGGSTALAVPGATPVPAQFLTSSQGVPTVVTMLPVAGTYITQYNLLGNWSVRVLLNGTFVQSAQFTLKAPDQP